MIYKFNKKIILIILMLFFLLVATSSYIFTIINRPKNETNLSNPTPEKQEGSLLSNLIEENASDEQKNLPLDVIFDQEKWQVVQSDMNYISLRENDDNTISIILSPSDLPISAVETRIYFDTNRSSITKVTGEENFSKTSTIDKSNSEKGVYIVFNESENEPYNSPEEVVVATIDYVGENTFSIFENRTLASYGNIIIPLKVK